MNATTEPIKIAIVYHSGYGHTQRQAEAVLAGANATAGSRARLLPIDADGNLNEADWETLQAADAIVFGSPTYMGSVSWQFKKFADASSKIWFTQAWKDKLSAGFTNSASMNGDKSSTLQFLNTLAMQHGMLWIGTGLLPANSKEAQRNDINYLGASSGLMAQSPSGSGPDESPLPGDLETAKLFGRRIAEAARRWHDGQR
ncbi:MAG: flavodoxin family protein [Burkholderiaceae bacterium]|nr:flavodoxin family protein [Burkholderiaceae bacterium]